MEGAKPPSSSPAEKKTTPMLQRQRRATPIGDEPAHDDADKLGQEVGREGPAIQVQATQVVNNGRQDGRHRQRLEGHSNDGQASGQPSGVRAHPQRDWSRHPRAARGPVEAACSLERFRRQHGAFRR